MPARRIVRDVNEDARDVARALAKTEAFEQSCRDRKRVEMLFAHLKRILRLGRLRLRGPRGAQDEFTLAAIAQNLRRLAQVRRQTAATGHGVRCVSVACVGASASKPPSPRGARQPAGFDTLVSPLRALPIADFCNKIGTKRTSVSTTSPRPPLPLYIPSGSCAARRLESTSAYE